MKALLFVLSAVAAVCAASCARTGRSVDQEARFLQARHEIEAAGQDFGRLDAVILESRGRCDAKPTSIDLFRWAYATVRRCRNDYDHYQSVLHSVEARKPGKLFATVREPSSFQFERVRLLYTVNFGKPGPEMVALGEKLLGKAPKDAPIMLALLKLYRPEEDDVQKAKGVDLIQRLDRQLPHDFSALRWSSFFYYQAWTRTHSPADGRESVLRGEEAIRLSRSPAQKELIRKRIEEVRARR